MTYQEKAALLHEQGYNCAQSVLLAFQDVLEMDEDILFRISEGLGAGMGGLKGTCGAISAACMIAGSTCSKGCHNTTTKGKSYMKSREIINRFTLKNGSITCSDLKGITTNQVLRHCDGCVEDAVSILLEVLNIPNEVPEDEHFYEK